MPYRFLKIKKILINQFPILIATSFSGLFVNNYAEATILNNGFNNSLFYLNSTKK